MEEIAERIVGDLAGREGFLKSDAEEKLKEVVLTMLEDMDEDTVEEIVGTIWSTAAEEHGE